MASTKQYTASEVEQLLKAHIAQEFAYDQPDLVLPNDLKLIEQRIIDSMAVFQLVSFLETAFGVICEPEELVLKNFETIDNLKAFILSKQAIEQ